MLDHPEIAVKRSHANQGAIILRLVILALGIAHSSSNRTAVEN
jgi:hypothetical protein